MLDRTRTECIGPVVSLLAMLMKMGSGNTEVENVTEILLIALGKKKNEENLFIYIHQVLIGVWMKFWKCNPFMVIVDPTERCLALITLKRDGSFKKPKHITTINAKLEYYMHLIFLQEIQSSMDVDGGIEEDIAYDALQEWFIENKYSTFSRLHSTTPYISDHI